MCNSSGFLAGVGSIIDLITTPPPHNSSDVHEVGFVTAASLCSHVLAFDHFMVVLTVWEGLGDIV